METIKEQILKELTQLIDDMTKYEDDVNEKMRNINDPQSRQWSYQSGKFSGMCDAVMKTLTTKFKIRELLEKLPDEGENF